MELKTNYQYTYFIHPFAIKEGNYQKYILKMLKEKKQFLVFEDVSGVKITDLTFTQQNSFKKPLEDGEAYFIQGGQIRKLKLVKEV